MTSSKKLISNTLANRMLSCIEEYELIKSKKSKTFKYVKDFCEYHKFSHQNFMKIYHRYKQNPTYDSLVPQKRGPKYKTRRTDISVEKRVIEIRNQELNRYEIRDILLKESEESKEKIVAPSASTIYNIIRRHGLSKLNKPQKEQKRKIIMSKIGELVHIDCHQLSKGITINNNNDDKTYYLLGIIDDYSRIAWAEVIDNKKALTVMFATLKAFNILNKQYNIQIDRVMTDNGAEFGGGKNTKNKEDHPFERLLLEMDMKHTYTRPYHPQTNGKIENKG